MSDLRTAAQQALEALELAQTDVHWELNSPTRKFLRKAEKTLRAALAQQDEPVQEPVAWLAPDGSIRKTPAAKSFREWAWGRNDFRPLYTAPPHCPNCASLKDDWK